MSGKQAKSGKEVSLLPIYKFIDLDLDLGTVVRQKNYDL
jgi:uncharacterized protein YkvS